VHRSPCRCRFWRPAAVSRCALRIAASLVAVAHRPSPPSRCRPHKTPEPVLNGSASLAGRDISRRARAASDSGTLSCGCVFFPRQSARATVVANLRALQRCTLAGRNPTTRRGGCEGTGFFRPSISFHVTNRRRGYADSEPWRREYPMDWRRDLSSQLPSRLEK